MYGVVYIIQLTIVIKTDTLCDCKDQTYFEDIISKVGEISGDIKYIIKF